MRKVTLVFSAIAFAFSLNGVVQAKVQMPESVSSGVTTVELSQRQAVHWVSVDQIEKSLQDQPPMAIGFDIDDTVLFSSPGFYRGKLKYSPNDNSYLKNPAFWEKMNNEWDEFSMPKQIGIELVQMHLKRGDNIYFITGRTKTKTETVTKYLQEDLHIPADKMNVVIFAGDEPGKNNKVSWMKEHKLKLYYGDADADIAAAHELNIRGIRILRASNSSYQPLPKAGRFGEEVVIKSEY
ncbi:acid phosphatase AphA [Xenorhabdus bovienii]|uniref:Class B acid phosphatase n=2 Tax=Xenorhabdus bovienii TaxID=40576 RepID=A0A077PIP3_XENBV|nr:acid phosphatase AphA [Xenorhabdus bovienii]MDE9480900.1 acid phosphatase AphA [Xenorhabdus bovienii]MDE9551132.1 acid phosphatase AphA [Xenorhabdus bovienii]MDE9554484.1 acid phosphatase AphA [Xenorhabdus bovienii]CDH20512.1 non-specific acid phosphatase/phosphotransferase,class B [Xenorhabdus bovienii str. kraussei Quebec]CDH34963.1 non-specific acid phosphatase/phosphotransferase,class B [Xenorhabdus bovienii str. Intermedium]